MPESRPGQRGADGASGTGSSPPPHPTATPVSAPAPASFGKSHRLLRGAQFRLVLRRATRSRDAAFLVCAQASGRAGDRLGITVSRKVDARAVGRNRIKRQIREFFRQQPGGIGIDFVVVANKPAATLSNHALRTELARHWQRLQRCARPRR